MKCSFYVTSIRIVKRVCSSVSNRTNSEEIMATSDPGSGPNSLSGVSDKLKSKVNVFREVIEGKKLEVRRVSKEMRSLIDKKEANMIQELETIWEEVNARMERKKTETETKIKEIESKEKEIEKLIQDLNPKPISFTKLSESIDSLEQEMGIDIPNVKLAWRLNEMEDCINRMGHCLQQMIAYNEDTHFQLKWENCDYGDGNSQLCGPWGIATNPIKENIYVADHWNHRIQIFSKKGEWIRCVKNDEMRFPQNILFHKASIYVQCAGAILKMSESTEVREKSGSYESGLEGICADNNHVYVGNYNGMSLLVLNLDLLEESRISLKTDFCRQDTRINDISLSQESFYVLLSETEHPIQEFSREGTLTRCVIKKDNINKAYCFCLDQQLNILVADNGDSRVKIFSNEGMQLTQFGEKGSEKGQFSDLRGIYVNELGSIVIVDCDNPHMLQLFSSL